MKKLSVTLRLLLVVGAMMVMPSCGTMGGLDMGRIGSALEKGTQALTLSNNDIMQYVTASVAKMDAQNKVAPASNAYTKRLNKLTGNLKSVNGIPLNFKVYLTNEVNAFACADGSVRVYSGIMDVMDDDELLSIIGHEIGHVAHEDSKNAFKQELLNSALLDVVGSTSSKVAALTDSQLGALANSLMSSKYSRKQENSADDYAYDFLKASNKNPYCMVNAFEKMQKLEQRSSAGRMTGNIANMFSSHPETSERIKHITTRCTADGFTRTTK